MECIHGGYRKRVVKIFGQQIFGILLVAALAACGGGGSSSTIIDNDPANPGAGGDASAPTVSITTPTTSTTYNTAASSLNLSGSASDNVGVTQVSWANSRGGGGNAVLNGGVWSVTGIALQSGTNVITVTARDAANNTGTDVLTVNYSSTPPPVGSTVTSVQVTNLGAAAQDVPVSFGQAFAPGDVPAGVGLAARTASGAGLPIQVDTKATHADGSLRHAVITTRLPSLGSGASETVELVTTTSQPPTGLLDAAALLGTTAFDTVVSLVISGQTYTASARSLLAADSSRTWLAGPMVTEWMVSAPLTRSSDGQPHDRLTARFNIRAYAGFDTVRVSVVVENTWSRLAGPQNVSYDATVSVNGRGTVLQQNNVNHYRQARWRRTFFWNNQPDLHVAHDTAYLARAGIVPTYDSRLSIPDSVLADMESSWNSGNTGQLMGPGFIYTYMPQGGGRWDIAPLPGWTARYLMTQDRRAKFTVLGTSEQAGSFPVHYRDRATDLPISIDTYPDITILGAGGAAGVYTCSDSCGTPYTPDVAHQPSLSYVPYLVTGDYFHLEELQFWANWNTFYWGDHGGSQGLVVNDQIRAQAWGLRTIGHAAYITPDDHPLKDYFVQKLNNNLDWYNANYGNNPPTPLGYLLNSPDLGQDNTFATWMDDFFTWTVGHLLNLGFDRAQPIFNYKARFVAGRMTDPDYCWILSGTYWTRARDPNTGLPYQNWLDFKNAVIDAWNDPSVGESFGWDPGTSTPGMSNAQIPALKAAVCNSSNMANILGLQVGQIIGYAWSHEGYPSNMQPALAIAAELDVAGADTGWAIYDARTVKPDSGSYDYNVNPQWAVVPRQ